MCVYEKIQYFPDIKDIYYCEAIEKIGSPAICIPSHKVFKISYLYEKLVYDKNLSLQ